MRPLFHNLAIALQHCTILVHVDKHNRYCLCVLWRDFKIYTGHYTRVGRYNRELRARWSFGLLYSRGCYFHGGVIIQRLRYVYICMCVRV